MCNRCHYFNDNNVANYDSQHFFWMPLCTKSKLKTIQLLTYSFSNFSKLNMLCFTKSQSKGIYDFIERKWTLTKMKNKLSVAFYCVLKFRLSYLYDASTKSFISKPSNRHQKYLRVLSLLGHVNNTILTKSRWKTLKNGSCYCLPIHGVFLRLLLS